MATLVEHLPVGVILVDRDGRTLLHNSAYTRLVPEAAIPSRLPDAEERWIGYDEEGQRIRRDRFAGARALRGEVVANAEFLHRAPDGQETWTHVSGVPLRNAAGEIAGAICVVVDIDAQKRAEERLQLATEAAELGIFDVDFTTGAMAWDARQRELWGIRPDEVITDELFIAGIHPEDRDRVPAGVARALDPESDGLYADEYRLVSREDRRECWIAATGRVHFDGRKPVRLIGTVQDITERKRTEAALRESEARLRALNADLERRVTERALARGRTWQLSPEIMGVLNADGYFEQSNPAWKAVLGWSEAEVAGTVFFDLIHPDDLAKTQEAFAAAIERGEPALSFENRYRHKDGGWRTLSWVAVPDEGKVYCSARDITVQKEQETELAERTAERNRMWRLSTDMMLVARFDGTINAINPAWERLLGWQEDELLGRAFFDFVHPDDLEATLAEAGKLSDGVTTFRFENRYRAKDGSYRWVSWIAVPEEGLIHAVGRDVTVEKEQQAELEAAQEQLRQSQKMEAMGQLTGGVAHDFNNLLTPIIGSLDRLLRRGVGSEREQRLMDGALQSAERAKTLVQRLLAFARRQPLQPGPVDIGLLVSSMADLVASTTGPRIDVRVDLHDDLPPALADANQLEMALLNLAVNARDAMPEGGMLTISAARESMRNPRHPAKLRPGHYVRLSVRDTGTGMDEATLARAVEPFFSTKGIGKGTGLGLSMVHGLASQLGGRMTITSRPGQGTTVDLWLPISAVAAEEDGQAHNIARAPKAQGTALLVDDEDLVRMSTADMLMDLGYKVVEATSAEEALRLVGEGLQPDLMVTDHLMPGLSGLDLARDLRSRWADLPVLIVSGYAEMDGIAPGFARLTKPFRHAELAASLAALVPSAER